MSAVTQPIANQVEFEWNGLIGGIIGMFKAVGAYLKEAIIWLGGKVYDFIAWTFESPERATLFWGSLAILYA